MAELRHTLLMPDTETKFDELPKYIREAPKISGDEDHLCPWNTDGTVTLNAAITKAILEYAKGGKSCIGLVKVGEGMYATEMELEDKSTLLTVTTVKGKIESALFSPPSAWKPVPEIGTKTPLDMSPIMMCYLMHAVELDDTLKLSTALDTIKAGVEAGSDPGTYMNSIYVLNDAVQCLLNKSLTGSSELIRKIAVEAGNISMLSKRGVQEERYKGEVLAGHIRTLIKGDVSCTKKRPKTIAEARPLVEDYVKTLCWSEQEKMLIPEFAEDRLVPEEAWDIIEDFVGTRGKRLQFNNAGIRGTSGYGKSTICKFIACILQTPLYVMPCNSQTETQDFLSKFVPASAPQVDIRQLPDIESMYMDPDGSYQQMTGVYREGVPLKEVQEVYNAAIAAQAASSEGGTYFKLVESDYVKALRTGAVLEVQEYNVIRDPGVMKGLNQFDEPGAVIPLVDGTYARRHPNALVIVTGNVGYSSSREEEWSVSRRIRTFIDVFEIPKEKAISRVMYNIEGALSEDRVKAMYKIWDEIRKYAKDEQIHTDLSLVSLENWCSAVSRHGSDSMEQYCRECVISQCTTDEEEQGTIWETVAKPAILAMP